MAKILLIVPSFTNTGGTDRMVAALANLLSDTHEVHVCSFDGPDARPRFDPGVPFHPLGRSRRLPLVARGLTYFREARRLKALKRALGTEVSISNLWRADLVSFLSQGSDCKIALAHINVVGNATNALMLRLRWLVAGVYRRLSRVVTVSDLLARELTHLYRLDEKKVRPISNFVAPPPESGRVAAPDRTLFWCARFVHEKNPMAVVPIFQALHSRTPSLKLVLIGDGPERELVRQAAERAGLLEGEDPPLKFAGIIEDASRAMAGGELFLLTSHSEGLPMVVLEALSVGVPVAAADCLGGGAHQALGARSPHNPERSDSEITECGILLPIPYPGTPAIQTWIDDLNALLGDKERMAALRAGVPHRAREFSPDVARPRWNELIREVLQER